MDGYPGRVACSADYILDCSVSYMRPSPLLNLTRDQVAADFAGLAASEDQIDVIYGAIQHMAAMPQPRSIDPAFPVEGYAEMAAWRHVSGQDVGLEKLAGVYAHARAELYSNIIGAVLAGMSEAEAARRSGVDRMTVRRLLGKR